MYKNLSYREKYALLSDWVPLIIESVKKDLKNEHLKNDVVFNKTYLGSQNINKVTTEQLIEAYKKAIAHDEKGEQIAEFITSRWLLKYSEIYDFFEEQLCHINPDFAAIDELDSTISKALIDKAVGQFGHSLTFLFSVLNSVVFPPALLDQLKEQAKLEIQQHREQQSQISEKLTQERTALMHEMELARLTNKYEKKVSGLQKKYLIDVEALKKQIALLQRKLQEKA